MTGRTGEPVKLPDHDDIKVAPLGIGYEPVKTGAAILAATDVIFIDFGNLPPSTLAILRQLMMLQVWVLFVRAYAHIDCSSLHFCPLVPVSKVKTCEPTKTAKAPEANQRLSASVPLTLLRHAFFSTAHGLGS